MATGPVLKKKQIAPVQERVPPVGNQPAGTIIQPGEFSTGMAGNALPANVTAAPSAANGTGQYTKYAQAGTSNGVPQSFVDGIADLANRDAAGGRNGSFSYNGKTYRAPGPNGFTQDEFTQVVNDAWTLLPPAKKQEYIQADTTATSSINQGNLRTAATNAILQAPQTDAQSANQYWSTNVAPAQQKAVAAQDAQLTGNRAAESTIAGNASAYGTTLDQNEALRMATSTMATSLRRTRTSTTTSRPDCSTTIARRRMASTRIRPR
jgi:hypothetical protein